MAAGRYQPKADPSGPEPHQQVYGPGITLHALAPDPLNKQLVLPFGKPGNRPLVATGVPRRALGKNGAAGGQEGPQTILPGTPVHIPAVVLISEGPAAHFRRQPLVLQNAIEQFPPCRQVYRGRVGNNAVQVKNHRIERRERASHRPRSPYFARQRIYDL